MTRVTWSTVSVDTPYRPLMTFETVEMETPASSATCCIVTRPRRDGAEPSLSLPEPTTTPGATTSFRDVSSSMVNLFSVWPSTVRLPGPPSTGHRCRGPRAEAPARKRRSALDRALQAADDPPLHREEQHERGNHRDRRERQHARRVRRVLGRVVGHAERQCPHL